MAELIEAGFIGGNHDRAAQLRTDPDWLAEKLDAPETRYVQFVADRAMIDTTTLEQPAIAFSQRHELWPQADGSRPVFLGFGVDGEALFAVRLAETDPERAAQELGANTKLIDLRSLALEGTMPEGQLALLAQARSLCLWHERHGFCANCGATTESTDGGYRRACSACNASHFPRTDPVVIMTVTHGDRMLLGRSPHFVPGMYSALAGFVEPGETIEAAARREVFEEAGITVGKVDYLYSQPWPFPSSLMIGLIGEAETDTIEMDADELEDVRWFEEDEVRLMLADEHPDGLKTPMKMAIAHHLVLAALKR